MYKTILLPLDGSPFSARAIPVAATLAKRTGATLHVVSVLDPSAYVPFVPGEVLVPVMDTDALEARRQADTEALQQVASELGAQGIHAAGTLLEGTVVESIGEYAVKIGADLVVMTTHGRSGLERLWLGSVATAFIQRSPCAVYLVRPSGGSAPVAESLVPTGPVLVPLDGSAFGDAIVYHAVRLAEALDAPLALYTVAIPHAIPMAPFGAEALLADEGDLSHQEQEARERLTALAGTLPPNCTVDVGTDMTAARPIIEKAAAIGASVIAMATHGRTGLARLVMGSVADAVLRGAPQALLLYRPTDREQQQSHA